MLKGADRLRCSLIPSLLEARRINQSLGNPVIELFETARIYLPRGGQLPHEQWTLGITSGGDYFRVKGVVEAIVAALNPALDLEVTDTRQPLLDPARSAQLRLGGRLLGYLGRVTSDGLKQCGLRSATTVAELDLSVLVETACLIPQHRSEPLPADRTRSEPDRRRIGALVATGSDRARFGGPVPGEHVATRKPTAIRRRTAKARSGSCSRSPCARPNAR
jgi:hypothetical protein